MAQVLSRLLSGAMLLSSVLLFSAADARAQQPPGFNPGKDCQTIRTCQFSKRGAFRGCLSSYTCRVCRPVPTRCVVAGRNARCFELRCTWGG